MSEIQELTLSSVRLTDDISDVIALVTRATSPASRGSSLERMLSMASVLIGLLV